jgi:hypothetical protein
MDAECAGRIQSALLARASEMRKPKHWFYFLRCLRMISLEFPIDSIRSLLAESGLNCDQAALDLDLLMRKACSTADDYRALSPLSNRFVDEGGEFVPPDVPSAILSVFRSAGQRSSPDLARLLDEQRHLILSNVILATALRRFLCQNPSLIS